MLPRVWLVLILLLGAGVSGTSSSAHHGFPGGHLPLLAYENVTGPGWVAIRFTTERAAVSFEHWVFAGPSTAFQAGARLYDASGEVVYASVVTVLTLQDGLHVRASPLGIDAGTVEPRVDRSFLGTGDAWDDDWQPRIEGVHTLLLWSAGTSTTNWTYFFRGEPGVTVLDVASGGEASLFLSGDFDADWSAQARGGDNPVYSKADLGGEATVAGWRSASADAALVAVFDRFDGAGAHLLSAHLPDGTDVPCPCTLDRLPPGEYGFQLSAGGLEVGGASGEVFLTILDVDMPA